VVVVAGHGGTYDLDVLGVRDGACLVLSNKGPLSESTERYVRLTGMLPDRLWHEATVGAGLDLQAEPRVGGEPHDLHGRARRQVVAEVRALCPVDDVLVPGNVGQESRQHHEIVAGTAGGIEREIAMLAPLQDRADVLIDTSAMSPHELRAEIAREFAREGAGELVVTVSSFSYKKGAPRGIEPEVTLFHVHGGGYVAGLDPFHVPAECLNLLLGLGPVAGRKGDVRVGPGAPPRCAPANPELA
jgi:chloramphenicol 3-O-phosphotransferase